MIERKHCENLIYKNDKVQNCSRHATNVVMFQGRVIEFLCTQHAQKVIKTGLAEGITVIYMQGTN